jgi:hypothetical protein
MAEVNTNPGLDALWAYARSLPLNEAYMDKKQRDIELARQIGFNTEHPATNEYLHQYAEKVRAAEREKVAEEIFDMCKEGWWDSEGMRHHWGKRGQA